MLPGAELEYKALPGAPANPQCTTLSDDEVASKDSLLILHVEWHCLIPVNIILQVLIKDNIYWKELTVLLSVWAAFVAVQIVKVGIQIVKIPIVRKKRIETIIS